MSLQRTTLTGVPFLVENSQVPAKQMLVAAFVHALVFEATGRAKIFAEPFSHFLSFVLPPTCNWSINVLYQDQS